MATYEIDPRTKAQISNAFVYHAVKDGQATRYTVIRSAAGALAELMASEAPPSRELSLALTNLEQAVMWANAAIARNE